MGEGGHTRPQIAAPLEHRQGWNLHALDEPARHIAPVQSLLALVGRLQRHPNLVRRTDRVRQQQHVAFAATLERLVFAMPVDEQRFTDGYIFTCHIPEQADLAGLDAELRQEAADVPLRHFAGWKQTVCPRLTRRHGRLGLAAIADAGMAFEKTPAFPAHAGIDQYLAAAGRGHLDAARAAWPMGLLDAAAIGELDQIDAFWRAHPQAFDAAFAHEHAADKARVLMGFVEDENGDPVPPPASHWWWRPSGRW